MPTLAFSAHFDGKHLIIDEPTDLPKNVPLQVLVLDPVDSERDDWRQLAANTLGRAYGEDEPEYSEADILPD